MDAEGSKASPLGAVAAHVDACAPLLKLPPVPNVPATTSMTLDTR